MQRLKRVIKRIGAVGTSVAMLGATMTGAVIAQDLADFPGPFISEGKYNQDTAIVIGANAAADDTIGAVDIVKMLQFNSKVCTPGSSAGGSLSVSGDAIEISDGSDLLDLRETLDTVRTTLTETELDGLRGGIVTTNEGTTQFNQYLRFDSRDAAGQKTITNVPYVNFTENNGPVDEVGDWLVVAEGSTPNQSFFEYELQFEEGLQSNIVSKKLDNFKNKEIMMMGTTYTFVDTKIDTSTADVTLKMLGGAIYDILEEGEVKTYTINGKEYQVEVLIVEDVSPPTVTFMINGEVTDQLQSGETEILKDGMLIGISSIILNEAGEAGSGDLVEVYLGATKVEMRDSNYSDGLSDTNSGDGFGFERRVRINEEDVEDAFAQIKMNQMASDRIEVQSIRYRLEADALPGYRDIYVPPGHGVREYLDEPAGMLGLNWDIRYEGLDDTGVSVIKLDPAGDDRYNLEFENRQGLIYKFPYVSNRNGVFKFGDQNDDFVFVEGNYTQATGLRGGRNLANETGTKFNIGILDYFILSNIRKNTAGSDEVNIRSGLDDTAFTRVVRYNSIDTSSRTIQIDDLATGTKQFVYDNASNSLTSGIIGNADLVFGGNTYKAFISNVTQNGGDNPLAVDMNADGQVNRFEITATTNGGGILDFGNASENAGGTFTNNSVDSQWVWNNSANAGKGGLSNKPSTETVRLSLITLSENFDENKPATNTASGAFNDALNFTIHAKANNKIGVTFNGTNIRGISMLQPDEDNDNYYGMSDYGVFANLFVPAGTNDAETLTIEYPLVQRGARVLVTFGDVKTTKTTAGEVCSVADIDVMSLLDSEVRDPTSYDLILVGGPCANNVVAQVPGFPACEDWPYQVGEGVVQLASNGDKVALLVAGTEGKDTRVAAKVLSKFSDYKLSGEKVKVSGTISSPKVEVA